MRLRSPPWSPLPPPDDPRLVGRAFLLLTACAALSGCAAPPDTRRDESLDIELPEAAVVFPAPRGDEWHNFGLPGKTATNYTLEFKDGRNAIAAVSDRSASMWRRRMSLQPQELGEVSFSWWVKALPPQASVADVDREDSAARVLFGFRGDIGSLPARTRMQFELAEALTGEKPPYATLMYVWDAQASVGSVIVNPRSDRIRKIVIDSGPDSLGRWRDHRRDLRADFRMAFGEEPGPLMSVAMMTDSDNTRSQVRAWYGPVNWNEPALLRPCTKRVQALSADPVQCTETRAHDPHTVGPGTNLNTP